MGICEAPGVPGDPGATQDPRGDTGDTGPDTGAVELLAGHFLAGFSFVLSFPEAVYSFSLFDNLKLLFYSNLCIICAKVVRIQFKKKKKRYGGRPSAALLELGETR